MIDDFAKDLLLGRLKGIREALVWKLDGLSEYDIRRPLTATVNGHLDVPADGRQFSPLAVMDSWLWHEVGDSVPSAAWRLFGEDDAEPEEVEVRSAVHLSFDRL